MGYNDIAIWKKGYTSNWYHEMNSSFNCFNNHQNKNVFVSNEEDFEVKRFIVIEMM